MNYSNEERALAKVIANDDMLALLEKVLSEKYPLEAESEKRTIELDDARYGQMMKVNFIARQHLIACLKWQTEVHL